MKGVEIERCVVHLVRLKESFKGLIHFHCKQLASHYYQTWE